MEIDGPTVVAGSILAIDHSDYCYRACSRCERVIPDNCSSSPLCKFCNCEQSKRLFRILMSIATDTKVKTVICFDRAAKVLFGCSADEFFHFAKHNPFAVADAGKILEGELFRMTLTKPKNTNAQHLRVTSIAPLRSAFQPVIAILKQEAYAPKAGTSDA